MNVQEQEQITRFLQQLVQAQVGAKDFEAERLIQDACGRQPDAHYLLVQRSMLLEQALGTAQSEIARLQKEQDSSRSRGDSFLNGNAWGNVTPQSQPLQRSANLAPAPQVPPAPMNTPGWGSRMLGTVAATAAGVVAGSFLFQGIGNLMGHHGSSSGLIGDNSPAPGSHAPAENLMTNDTDDVSTTHVDFDALGPDNNDPDWA